MEGVTDTVFRQIIADCGKPDVFFTEFTNVDAIKHYLEKLDRILLQAAQQNNRLSEVEGHLANASSLRLNKKMTSFICSSSIACKKSISSLFYDEALRRLQYSEVERPIVAQIWGNRPESYVEAVKLIIEMKFDGVDINMGCPVWGVVKKGECAGLINNPELAKKIIAAVKKGAENKIPVSVKTRIGYNKIETEKWIGFLLKQGLDAITIHGRIAKDRSKVAANWEEIGKAVLLRNKLKVKTAIIGNGDVKSREEAVEKWRKYGVDGVMIGKGMLENPWVFANGSATERSIIPRFCSGSTMSRELKIKKLKLLIKHINLFKETYGESRNFLIMKKFYKTYVNGFTGAKQLREELMEIKTAEETIEKILLSFPRRPASAQRGERESI